MPENLKTNVSLLNTRSLEKRKNIWAKMNWNDGMKQIANLILKFESEPIYKKFPYNISYFLPSI